MTHNHQAEDLRRCCDALAAQLRECQEVLRILAQPGWLHDALQSGDVTRLAREISALKRQARAALAQEQS